MKQFAHKTISTVTLAILGTIIFSLGLAINVPSVYADDICSMGLNGEVNEAICGSPTELSDVIQNIVKAVIGVCGVVAVVFIVIGGINYMTSNGDTSKIEKAKKTIIYALIGLAVAALSFVIVNWGIKAINGS